jgi:hypothetical protein
MYATKISQYRFVKGALSGQVQQIAYHYALNPDCSSEGPVSIETLVPPKNGIITFTPSEDYPSYRTDNIRSACDKQKIPVTAINYQSNPGFVGTDTTRVEILYPKGDYHVIDYTINVR